MKGFLLCLLPTLLLMAGCSPENPLTLAAGEVGGAFYEQGGRVAEIVGDVAVLPTRGSEVNLALLREGKVDLALVRADVYAEEEDLAAICVLYAQPLQWVEAASGSGQALAVAPDSTQARIAEALPDIGEIASLPVDQSLTAYTQLEIGGILLVGDLPDGQVLEAGALRSSNLVSLTDDQLTALTQAYPYLVPYTIQAGTYEWQTEAVNTVGVPVLLISRTDLPTKTVTDILESLTNSREYGEAGVKAPGWISLHGAAADYFNR